MPATSKVTTASAISLRPSYKNKPTTTKMKQIISAVLQEKLENVPYQSERASQLTKEIADAVKLQLKACEFPRCKYLVQVVIGEQRGEGVRMGCRCFWDSETDCYATETYTNDSLFCVATAYSIYLY
ncbi:tctex1 domain-containing protein 2 [Achlya hypogyna]|uniref:Tctex1 domain-containing protein 2 n=1 Tax=Achlya hypogyna TaxID=1202772 RepID=A0A1V9ZFA4_ACHHY|nr:tctex1 domain-containing protein 2 [Achlya hypogyna]